MIGSLKASLRRRWNYDNTVSAVVCCVAKGLNIFMLGFQIVSPYVRFCISAIVYLISFQPALEVSHCQNAGNATKPIGHRRKQPILTKSVRFYCMPCSVWPAPSKRVHHHPHAPYRSTMAWAGVTPNPCMRP